MSDRRAYIGDGVYADFDGYSILLEADREYGVHRIYLDPSCLLELDAFRRRLSEEFGAPQYHPRSES